MCLTVPTLVLLFERIHAGYKHVGEVLGLGEIPASAEPQQAMVVVPVGAVSRLTREAICAALSLAPLPYGRPSARYVHPAAR